MGASQQRLISRETSHHHLAEWINISLSLSLLKNDHVNLIVVVAMCCARIRVHRKIHIWANNHHLRSFGQHKIHTHTHTLNNNSSIYFQSKEASNQFRIFVAAYDDRLRFTSFISHNAARRPYIFHFKWTIIEVSNGIKDENSPTFKCTSNTCYDFFSSLLSCLLRYLSNSLIVAACCCCCCRCYSYIHTFLLFIVVVDRLSLSLTHSSSLNRATYHCVAIIISHFILVAVACAYDRVLISCSSISREFFLSLHSKIAALTY